LKAVVLAAGYGTRLYPLTKDKAKPLLEINNKPILTHIVRKLEELPLAQVIVVTNEKFFEQFQKWQAEKKFKIEVKVISDGTTSEKEKKGALADIKFALEKENINEDFCVINGDNLFNFSLKPVFEAFQKKKENWVCLYDVGFLKKARELGVAELDKENKIVGFEEKPENPVSTLASTGIYFFPQKTAPLLSDYLSQKEKFDRPGDFIHWLYTTHSVYGFVCHKKWFDIGSFDSLEQAKKEFKEAENGEDAKKEAEVEEEKGFFGLKGNR
jgi:glucose-1-phosphate thymidylyltransferase